MKKFWALGTLAAFILAAGGTLAAQQAATKPAAQKPAVAKAAKAEKEDVEKDEQEGAKTYKITVQLPAPVTAAFKKAYPSATIRGTAKETENGKTVYEVESVENGKARDFMYAADGAVLEIEEELNPADLPGAGDRVAQEALSEGDHRGGREVDQGDRGPVRTCRSRARRRRAYPSCPTGRSPAPEKK